MFSQMLVDLNLLIKPRLYIMDGIIGMEGNGPRNGIPKPMRVLLFSTDPVALDAVLCKLINLDPGLVQTLVYGEKFGLGSMQEIEFVGDDWSTLVQPDFDVNRDPQATTSGETGLAGKVMRQFITPRPYITPELCNHCGQCVRICPAEPKALSWKKGKDTAPVYDYSLCIRCYCCQELCPHEVISVKVPPLGRLIKR
jgi:Pyruvate/2-oxoacid:ferredoxin oxidoreductase delta subunit